MKIEFDQGRDAQIYVVRAKGNTIAEAAMAGLAQACDAVDRIAQTAGSDVGAGHAILDIDLDCEAAADLRQEALTFWDSLAFRLDPDFPAKSFAFWLVVGRLQDPPAPLVEQIDDFFNRIEAVISRDDVWQVRSTSENNFGQFEGQLLSYGNPAYLSCYMRLMPHWDMGHTDILAFVNDIVDMYGRSSEIETLIPEGLIDYANENGFRMSESPFAPVYEWLGRAAGSRS